MAFFKNVYKDKGDSDSLKLSAKKHPVKGIVSTILAVLSLLLFVTACILAGVKNGKAPMYLRLEVPDDARHVGGLTIFGRDFGNYNQDIEFRIVYSD